MSAGMWIVVVLAAYGTGIVLGYLRGVDVAMDREIEAREREHRGGYRDPARATR